MLHEPVSLCVIVGNEGGDVFIDATLLQEPIKFILDSNIKLGSRTGKVSSLAKADVKRREKSTAGPMYKPWRFQSALAVSSWLEKQDEVAHSSRDSNNLKDAFGSQQAPEVSKHHQSNIPARGKSLHYTNEADEHE